MPILIVGATGATGQLLVGQLLDHGLDVKIIVRSPEKLPGIIKVHTHLTVIHANIMDLSDDEIKRYVDGCYAIASCLGHNISLKGIFGHPRRLVTDVTRRLCNAIKANKPKGITKFVLMNTAGNSNLDLNEPQPIIEKCIISLMRFLLPPQKDNEDAADYLRTDIGQNNNLIEWVVVRPDSLIDEDKVSGYDVYPSPIRSAIFNAGSTSRINVAHFMADLIVNNGVWNRWKGKMPVIYNKSSL